VTICEFVTESKNILTALFGTNQFDIVTFCPPRQKKLDPYRMFRCIHRFNFSSCSRFALVLFRCQFCLTLPPRTRTRNHNTKFCSERKFSPGFLAIPSKLTQGSTELQKFILDNLERSSSPFCCFPSKKTAKIFEDVDVGPAPAAPSRISVSATQRSVASFSSSYVFAMVASCFQVFRPRGLIVFTEILWPYGIRNLVQFAKTVESFSRILAENVTNQWKPWQKSCFFCGQWIT
jgi:hypothetical protein